MSELHFTLAFEYAKLSVSAAFQQNQTAMRPQR